MKTTKIFALAALLTVGLAGCSKDGGETPSPAENFSVVIGFTNAAHSRADGAAAVDGTAIDIVDGYLCFVNSGGTITDVYTIGSGATAGKNILNTDLGTSPVTLQGIPGSSVKVCMIANKGTLSPAPTVGNNMVTYLNDNTMAVTDQSVYTAVTSTGEGNIIGSEATRTASIPLATKVSRIQIEDLAFAAGMTGTVEGIFINGFYPTMSLDGTGADWKSSLNKAHYVAGATDSPFTNALQSYVYDTFSKTIAATVAPANGVWGYNLFASATPQIIIKLDNVAVGSQNYSDPQFITVNGFSASGAPITTLAGGMIYTIKAGTLVVKPEHLSPDPGTTPFSVAVTVTQAVWDETVVTPNL